MFRSRFKELASKVVYASSANTKLIWSQKAAYDPINFLNMQPKPSKKQKVKNADESLLSMIAEKIRVFSLMTRQDQLANLKFGSQRRNKFRNININCEIESESDIE